MTPDNETLERESRERLLALRQIIDRCFAADEANLANDILAIAVPISDAAIDKARAALSQEKA